VYPAFSSSLTSLNFPTWAPCRLMSSQLHWNFIYSLSKKRVSDWVSSLLIEGLLTHFSVLLSQSLIRAIHYREPSPPETSPKSLSRLYLCRNSYLSVLTRDSSCYYTEESRRETVIVMLLWETRVSEIWRGWERGLGMPLGGLMPLSWNLLRGTKKTEELVIYV